jgi:hypothetical protein
LRSWFTRTVITGSFAVTVLAVSLGTAQAVTSGPTSTTDPATSVSVIGADMHGSIATGGTAVKWRFYWGPIEKELVHTTPLRTIAAGSGTVHVSAVTTAKLAPHTKYYFALVAEYQAAGDHTDTAGGRAKSFTTKSGSVKVTPSAITAKHDVAATPITCFTKQACKGKLTITDQVGTSSETFGSKSFSISAKRTSKVDVKLSSTAVALLKKAHKQTVYVTLTTATTTGLPTFTKHIELTL